MKGPWRKRFPTYSRRQRDEYGARLDAARHLYASGDVAGARRAAEGILLAPVDALEAPARGWSWSNAADALATPPAPSLMRGRRWR